MSILDKYWKEIEQKLIKGEKVPDHTSGILNSAITLGKVNIVKILLYKYKEGIKNRDYTCLIDSENIEIFDTILTYKKEKESKDDILDFLQDCYLHLHYKRKNVNKLHKLIVSNLLRIKECIHDYTKEF